MSRSCVPVQKLWKQRHNTCHDNRNSPERFQNDSRPVLKRFPVPDSIKHISEYKQNIGIATHKNQPCQKAKNAGLPYLIFSLFIPLLIPAQVVKEQIKQKIRIDMGKTSIVRSVMKQVRPISNHDTRKQRHPSRKAKISLQQPV